MNKGKFITVEGVDGSGKSTMAKHLHEYLVKAGIDCILVVDPGTTELGKQLRSIVLNTEVSPITETLLFAASRSQLVDEIIKPALEKGTVVISDRYLDSSYAYQGLGRGLVTLVDQLENALHHFPVPDHTLFLDITLEESFKRILERSGSMDSDRFESAAIEFKKRVYEGYNYRFNEHPSRMYRIDASGSMESVKDQIETFAVQQIILGK